MHLFISAGEPSGDLHASNLIRSLKQIHPEAKIVGFGGEKMEAAGMRLLFPMTRHAVMGFLRAIAKIFTFKAHADQAVQYFHKERPDAVLLIDFSGFNLPLAKRAKAAGIPVYWFIPPQLWAWRGWRVRQVRKWVDHVLSVLPFEYRWYRKRHVPCTYVGHPYFDELSREVPDAEFVADQRQRGGRIVALLPGSRMQEVTKNAASMMRSAELIHERFPDTRFLIAAFNDSQAEVIRSLQQQVRAPVEVFVKRTPEIIRLAEACISVSGSVGLELMYSEVPSVVVYRASQSQRVIANLFIKIRYMSLVNLLADRELYPEFPVA
jgi:lipid-A-disaccharide synthase